MGKKLKVVYCGGLDYCPYAPDHLGIKQGLEFAGYDWIVVDPILNDPNGKEIAREINDFKPDYVIHGNTDSLTKKVCQHVDPQIKQIFWMLDYRLPGLLIDQVNWNKWVTNREYLTALFISAKDHIEPWRNTFHIPTFYAPHACWIPNKLSYDEKYDRDVLFIGSQITSGPLGERSKLLKEIENLLRNKGIEVTYVNASEPKDRDQIWLDMPKWYYSSKVVLDVSHFWKSPGYSSGRYWYTAALGACAVTKAFPECETFFENRKHKFYFNAPQEAVILILGLLDNGDLRNNVKKKVAKYAWRKHNYKIRFQEIFAQVDEL